MKSSDHNAASLVLMAISGMVKKGVSIIPARSNNGTNKVNTQMVAPIIKPLIKPFRLARGQ